MYLENSLYAKILLHPHPHTAFQSLVNDIGVYSDLVSKNSANVGVGLWYYSPPHLMPLDSDSSGALF